MNTSWGQRVSCQCNFLFTKATLRTPELIRSITLGGYTLRAPAISWMRFPMVKNIWDCRILYVRARMHLTCGRIRTFSTANESANQLRTSLQVTNATISSKCKAHRCPHVASGLTWKTGFTHRKVCSHWRQCTHCDTDKRNGYNRCSYPSVDAVTTATFPVSLLIAKSKPLVIRLTINECIFQI